MLQHAKQKAKSRKELLRQVKEQMLQHAKQKAKSRKELLRQGLKLKKITRKAKTQMNKKKRGLTRSVNKTVR